MSTFCFYHSADLDGRCCGAIMHRVMPDAKLIPYNYGEPFPWELISGHDIHMADVSLQPFSEMIKLVAWVREGRIRELVWIDHHKSAIESCLQQPQFQHPYIRLELGNDVAACELAWRHYFPNEPLPEAVHLLGVYDVWKWQDVQGALEFQYGMRLDDWRDVKSNKWKMLLAPEGRYEGHYYDPHFSVESIIRRGLIVLDYQRQQDKVCMSACAFDTTLDGYRVLAVNRGPTNSQLFDSRWDPAKYDMMLAFYLRRDGKWSVSLYSDKSDIDCSAVAKKRGGGGHKGAAGFQSTFLDFLEPR